MRIMCMCISSSSVFYGCTIYTKSNFYPPPPLLRGVRASPRRAGRRRGGGSTVLFSPPHPYCPICQRRYFNNTDTPYHPAKKDTPYHPAKKDTPYHPAKKNALTPLPPFAKIKWKVLCLCTTRLPVRGLFFFR